MSEITLLSALRDATPNTGETISRSGVLAGFSEPVMLDTNYYTIIEHLTFSTNSYDFGGVRIRMRTGPDGATLSAVSTLLATGSGMSTLAPKSFAENGSEYFDFLEFDVTLARFKFALKRPMTFPQGVEVRARNTGGSDINLAMDMRVVRRGEW